MLTQLHYSRDDLHPHSGWPIKKAQKGGLGRRAGQHGD